MKQRRRHEITKTRRRAFTMVEALIAIAILLVIILFTAKIFGSAKDVAVGANASADLMSDFAAIDGQIRSDFQRLSRDGFIVIQCRAIRNSINDPSGTNPRFWLNPDLSADAWIRSDRIVFFADGTATSQIFGFAGTSRKAQSGAQRIYYGHGFQLGELAFEEEDIDYPASSDFPPWFGGSLDLHHPTAPDRTVNNFSQPEARQWTLARQAILLADDGGNSNFYLSNSLNSTSTIWEDAIRDARIDIAASNLNDVRNLVTRDSGTGNPLNWSDQWQNMRSAVFYPRAELTLPTAGAVSSMLRRDQALTMSTLGTAVSDVMIDWTYADGTGFTVASDDPNTVYPGVSIPAAGETPWFGLPDDAAANLERRNVWMLDDEQGYGDVWWDVQDPIDPTQIEVLDTSNPDIVTYTAAFGYNQTRPLDARPNPDEPWYDADANSPQMYTPWPDAIRITLRLHDPQTRIGAGRLVQFVVKLPPNSR